MPKRAKLSRTVLIGVAVAAVAGTLVLAFLPKPLEVDLGTAARGTLTVTIDEEGRTRVAESFIVSTPVAGRLLRVQVHAGDEVEGSTSVVARMRPINPAVLDSRTREQALAAVDAAEAALRVARANLNAAQATEDLSASDFERTQRLFDSGIESEAALDRARNALQAGRASRETAEAAIAMREAELANARASLIGFEDSGLANALGETAGDEIPLYAPIDGRILRVMQESETTLPAGAPILEIGNIASDLEVVVDLLSADAVQVEVGDPVILRDWGGPQDLSGEVVRIDPVGMTQFSALGVEEQRVQVEIALLSAPGERVGLGHGYRLEAAIVIWQQDDVLTVPASALFREDGRWSLFVHDGGTARLTAVEVGPSDGLRTQVTAGLTEGTEVVLYPSAAVSDGSLIAPRALD